MKTVNYYWYAAASLAALSISVAAGTAAAAALAAAWIPAAVAASIATFGGAAAAGGSAVAGAIGANQAFAQAQFVPKLDLSALGATKRAKGGIIRKPELALLGEAGPEAVIPLNNNSGSSIGLGSNINVSIKIDKAVLDNPSNIDSFVQKLNEQLYYLIDRGTKRSRTANA